MVTRSRTLLQRAPDQIEAPKDRRSSFETVVCFRARYKCNLLTLLRNMRVMRTARLDSIEGVEAIRDGTAAPDDSRTLLAGQKEGNEAGEQGMGQLSLTRSTASMRHLQESLKVDLDAVQRDCQQRENELRSAKQSLQEATPFAITMCMLTCRGIT